MVLKKAIFIRVIALIFSLTVTIALFYVFYNIGHNRRMNLDNYLIKAQNLTHEFSRKILWNDRVRIRLLLKKEVQTDNILDYAFIDKSGEPYEYSFTKGVPVSLLTHSKKVVELPDIWKFKDEKGRILFDLAVRIDNTGSVLHLGLNRDEIDRELYPLHLTTAISSLIIILLGMGMSLLLANRVTREVSLLIQAIHVFGIETGRENLKVPTKGSEVTLLVETFNRLISERNQAEAALRESEERLQMVIRGAELGLWDRNIQTGDVIYNERWAVMLGYSLEEIEPHAKAWENLVHPEDRRSVTEKWNAHLEGKSETYEAEYRLRHKSGNWIWVLDKGQVTARDSQGRPLRVCGTHLDITENKRQKEEREKIQKQLIQAQKMEAVGRLAGGVAHDYNNMLCVIIGYTELAMETLESTEPLYDNLEQILKAAEQSTEITRQLLAFARRQTISPRVIDLNETIEGMLKMLRRLIGEDIELEWKPGKSLWPVKMDPTQIDQILANLCVNARDAITDVGKIIIETGNDTFDGTFCSGNEGYQPGEYVRLSVSDNGCGMSREIIGNIFEPFFTTKEVRKGTGLGLSTVYGIVKQNGGFINVYSEPEYGTIFKIYLLHHQGEIDVRTSVDDIEIPQGRGERILLVEDDLSILTMSKTMLERLGYRVIAANRPGQALELARTSNKESIQLLITDLIMPEMNGRDLANQLLTMYPNLRTLFMSGYTADVIAHHGVLEEDVHFIQKPFSKNNLAIKVRETLDSKEVIVD